MNKWGMRILWIVNILLYLVVVGTLILVPEEKTLNVSTLVFSLAFTALLLFIARKRFETFYHSQKFKKTVAQGISAFLLLFVLGIINYLAFKNPINIDVTKNKKNTLTEQSRRVVQAMEHRITAKIFSEQKNFETIRSLLELYRYEKNDIHIEFIDVGLRPDLVKAYDIIKSPGIVLEYDGKKQQVKDLSELGVTNTLIALSRQEEPLIFYSIGHGEVDLTSKDNTGGLSLSRMIDRSSYRLRKVNLNTISSIPEAVKVLIIWGPKSGFFDNEIKMIDSYLQKGGRLLTALDPTLQKDHAKKLRRYLRTWGIEIKNNFVIDRLKHINGSKGTVPIVDQLEETHPITKGLRVPIFFPLASEVKKIGDHTSVKILAYSSPFPASWAENTPSELVSGVVTYGKERDTKGPIGYLGVWEKTGSSTKIVAFGNSSFIANAYASFPRNFMLFLNALSWPADEDHLLSLDNTVIKDRPVFIAPGQMGLIFYSSVLLIPLGLFTFSLVIYRRRLKL